jgi:protein-S-isoprenylcysteine O-methyltransferase Ste14
MSREQRLIVWTVTRVVVVVAFAVWLVLFLRRWDRLFRIALPAWLRIPGAVLICAGAIGVAVTAAALATRGILEERDDRLTPRSLATSGPFQYSRNPMSLGVVLIFAGVGAWCLSPSILLFSVMLFFLLHLLVVYVEEPRLRKRFWELYRDYERHTNRWCPSIRKI